MRILHIVPESINIPSLYYLGSTKDIWGRIEYFSARSMDFERLIVERSDEVLLERLKSIQVASYSAIFIELPIYPKSIAFIRKNSPTSKIYCRSINAELYHQLHSFLSNYKHQRRTGVNFLTSFFMNSPVFKSSLFRLRQDYKCGRLSDILFSIADWETRYYWRYLVGGKVKTLPYFLPSKYEEEIYTHNADKENICISFMGVGVEAGSFLADSLYNFANLIRTLNEDHPEWTFMITSDTSDISKDILIPDRIKPTGFLETPYPLLARSRAVAILSPYGYGFKTKILEAILSGCYVILPSQLKTRLPNAVKPFCIEVDLNSVASFKRALSQCLEPFPSYNPNTDLKEEAFRVLDELFH